MTVVELSVTGQQETDLAKRKAKKLLYIITKSSWKNNRSDQLKAYKVPTESVVLQGLDSPCLFSQAIRKARRGGIKLPGLCTN